MRILSLICSESVVRDAETGQVVIFNVIDDITTGGFPLLLPKFSVYFFSERKNGEPDSQEVKLSISSNLNLLFSKTFPVNFNNKLKNKSIIGIRGFVIESAGSIFVKITTPQDVSLYEKEIIVSAKQNIEIIQAPPQ